MSRAKRNRGSVRPRDLHPEKIKKGMEKYREWHWFGQGDNLNQKVKHWDDPDYPNMLVECGRLIRMHVRLPKSNPRRHPRRDRDSMIELSQRISEQSFVAFDLEHPHQRLYLLTPDAVREEIRRKFWEDNSFRPLPLKDVAMRAGGRHGKMSDYPNVMVKPIGVLTAVVYRTHKKGDEMPGEPRSYYIHRMAEITGYFPFLCVDSKGRLWLAGGSYTSPVPGITD